uniref:Uncharacterized protein n=1 Tax=Graphocephala atropunctata TaxID=36148 RepID=A0A1B6KBH1_9HEMI
MLVAVVFVSMYAAVMAAPQNPQVPPQAPNMELLLNNAAFHNLGNVNEKNVKNVKNKKTKEHNVENMYSALDVHSMVKAFDPKLVVVNEQQGEMPEGVHDALVKSLISDLHAADVPVVYAQKRNIPV